MVTINAKSSQVLRLQKIVIDPGHGGVDPGTVYGDIFEKDINLSISKFLKEELEKYGATVKLTREGDYDLSAPNALYRKKSDFNNRIKFINSGNFDMYLSIHLNYLEDSAYYGPQVFYKKEDQGLASNIQQVLNKHFNGTRNIKLIPNDTYMFKRLSIPGVLIECGFLSNTMEREKLTSTIYQQEFAKVLSQAIVVYFT